MSETVMTNPNEIKDIVIVGGGTAGWMAAATLGHLLDAHRINVTLVESEAIGTVGVGEATIPPILLFNNMLGIDENEFIAATKATFKTGIEFVNWGGLGESYLHPFGDFGRDIETLPLHHHWLRARANGYKRDLYEFSLMAKAAAKRRFMRPEGGANSVFSAIHYAYQFDAGRYAAFLRTYSEARGVKRVEGRVSEVHQDPETGHVTGLGLEDGREVGGTFFIDCSGFRGLLIEGALQTGYEDWRRYLPVDRAVALPCKKNGEPIPYTRATAHGAGWQWRIPLQHRTGNGHVYCSEFMSADEAEATLRENLDGAPTADAKHLRFMTGHRKKFWDKNVLSLGLAAGFMEPLESTSIHLVQTGLARLMALFPDRRFNQVDIDAYNARTRFEYERVRDFLVLHYVATKRDDTEFWRYCQTLPRPETLVEKIAMYESAGRIHREKNELFTEASWLAVMHGQGIRATGWNPVADRFEGGMILERLENMYDLLERASDAMPNHAEYLKAECLGKLRVAEK